MLGEIKETVEAVGVAVDLPPEDRVNREIVDPLWKTLNEIKAVYATIATSDPTFPAPADCVLRPVSQQNLSYGEKLPRVYFDIQPNRVIFATGDEIARTRFDGTLDKAILLEQFFQFDKRVQDKLLRMGVLEASLTRKLDQISAGLLLNFSEIVNQIRQLRKWVTVRMVAQDAIKVYGEIDAVYQLGKADEHSEIGRAHV